MCAYMEIKYTCPYLHVLRLDSHAYVYDQA